MFALFNVKITYKYKQKVNDFVIYILSNSI